MINQTTAHKETCNCIYSLHSRNDQNYNYTPPIYRELQANWDREANTWSLVSQSSYYMNMMTMKESVNSMSVLLPSQY